MNSIIVILKKLSVAYGKFDSRFLPEHTCGFIKSNHLARNNKLKIVLQHSYVFSGTDLYNKNGYICECGEAFTSSNQVDQHLKEVKFKDFETVITENVDTQMRIDCISSAPYESPQREKTLTETICKTGETGLVLHSQESKTQTNSMINNRPSSTNKINSAIKRCAKIICTKYRKKTVKPKSLSIPTKNILILEAMFELRSMKLGRNIVSLLSANLSLKPFTVRKHKKASDLRKLFREESPFSAYITSQIRNDAEKLYEKLPMRKHSKHSVELLIADKSQQKLIAESIFQQYGLEKPQLVWKECAQLIKVDYCVTFWRWVKTAKQRIKEGKVNSRAYLITQEIKDKASKIYLTAIALFKEKTNLWNFILPQLAEWHANTISEKYLIIYAKMMKVDITKVRRKWSVLIMKKSKQSLCPSDLLPEIEKKASDIHRTIINLLEEKSTNEDTLDGFKKHIQLPENGEKKNSSILPFHVPYLVGQSIFRSELILAWIYKIHGIIVHPEYLKACATLLEESSWEWMSETAKQYVTFENKNFPDQLRKQAMDTHEKVMNCLSDAYRKTMEKEDELRAMWSRNIQDSFVYKLE